MIGFQNRILHTDRLTLRLAADEDKAALWPLLQDGTVTAPAGFAPILTEAEFDCFFSELIAYGTGLAILAGDTLIGYARVNKEVLDDPMLEGKTVVGLGFVIGKPYQNMGYGTEMLSALTAYLKERFDFCMADHFTENIPSRRVIEKCGYRYYEDYSMVFEHLGPEKKSLKSWIF